MNFKGSISVIILLVFSCFTAQPQIFEKNKTVQRSFASSPKPTVQLSNKYGNIHLFTWNKDSVNVSVEVNVSDKKELNAQKTLDNIDFYFTATSSNILANTMFKNARGEFKTGFNEFTGSFFNSAYKVKINYMVYLPAGSDLVIENKYGNIYMPDIPGNIDLKLVNGDLQAGKLSGDVKLDISYGNAFVNSMNSGNLSLSYTDIEINSTGKITVDSKSSRIRINKSESIFASSTKDKLIVDTLGSISGKTYFTYLNISSLKESLILKTTYGEIFIDCIMPDFKLVDVNSSYTDLSFKHSSLTDVKLDLSTKKTSISLPADYKNITKTPKEGGVDEFYTSGVYGAEKSTTGLVKCLTTAGSIYFGIK